MNKLFVYFSTKAKFLAATEGTEYDNTSIVFIADSKEIWNRGVFYATPIDFDINDYATVESFEALEAEVALKAVKADVEAELANKADKADTYTKAEVDEAIEAVDVSDQLVDYAKTEYVDTELAKKADKTEISDMATMTWVGQQSFDTVASVDAKIANAKSEIIGGAGEDYDTLKEIETWVTEHQDLYTALVTTVGEKAAKSYVDEELAKKADKSDTYTKAEVDEAIEAIDVTEQLDDYAKKSEVEASLETKANSADVYKKSETYTKAEVDKAIEDALTWAEY